MPKFEGLPHEEAVFVTAQTKLFHSLYGKDTKAASVYEAQPNHFPAFTVEYPRSAFLLDTLWQWYRSLDSWLEMFQPMELDFRYRETSPWRRSVSNVVDGAFAYFQSNGDEQKEKLLRLRAWLARQGASNADSNRAPAPLLTGGPTRHPEMGTLQENERRLHEIFLYMQLANDVLDFIADEDRNAIVQELLSADVARTIFKGTSAADASVGFWRARANIQTRETELQHSVRYLNKALLAISLAQVGSNSNGKALDSYKAPRPAYPRRSMDDDDPVALDYPPLPLAPPAPPLPMLPVDNVDLTLARDLLSDDAGSVSCFNRDRPPPRLSRLSLPVRGPIDMRVRERERERERAPGRRADSTSSTARAGTRVKRCVCVRPRRCDARSHHSHHRHRRNLTPESDSSDDDSSTTVNSVVIRHHSDDDDEQDEDDEDCVECADVNF